MNDHKQLWKPWDAENFSNPYPMYKALQQSDPIHFSQTKEWIITRYEDVRTVLKDNRFVAGNRLDWIKRGIAYLNNKEMDFQAIASAMSHFLLFLNPPQHTRVRKFIHGVWTNRDIEPLIRSGTQDLISQLPKQQVDIVKDFGQVLPALTMANILGIPTGDHRYLKSLALNLIKGMDLYISVKDLVLIHQSAKEFIDYFNITLQEKRMKEDGLLHKIIMANEKSDEPLTNNELISISIFLFTAGVETTSGVIGTGVYNLITRNQWLERDQEAWDLCIDELLRYDSPVQLLGRISTEEIELGGKIIPKGSTITLCLGAANRDPEIFDQPDELILTRSQNRHLAFGSGIHFCMGDWLGKLQARIALEELVKTYPTSSAVTQDLKWNKNLAIRSLTEFKVTII
jgi:pimeloyl-[acyl-carrier protein] synthase